MKHAAFGGRLLMLGFGSIGQGVLPLILRHIDMPKDRIEILTSDARGRRLPPSMAFATPSCPSRAKTTRRSLVRAWRRGISCSTFPWTYPRSR